MYKTINGKHSVRVIEERGGGKYGIGYELDFSTGTKTGKYVCWRKHESEVIGLVDGSHKDTLTSWLYGKDVESPTINIAQSSASAFMRIRRIASHYEESLKGNVSLKDVIGGLRMFAGSIQSSGPEAFANELVADIEGLIRSIDSSKGGQT